MGIQEGNNLIEIEEKGSRAIFENEMAQALYKQIRISLPGTWITTLLAVLVFWRVAGQNLLLTWFFTYTAYMILRYLICTRYHRLESHQATGAEKIMVFTFLSAVSGSFWGFLAFQIIPEVPNSHAVLVILFAGGLTASAVASYAVAPRVSYAFMMPFLGSIIWVTAFRETGIHHYMAAMTFLYMVVLMITARQMHFSVVESFHLQIKNTQLLAHLKKAQTAQENLNQDLLSEITLRKNVEMNLKINLQVLEAAKREVDQANKAQSGFLATMSHEIRTPLNSIIMAANRIRKGNQDPAQKNFADMILSSGEALLRLINEILDHASIDSNRIKLEIVKFNFKKLLEKILNTYRDRAENNSIHLVLQYDPNAPEMITQDPYRIRQVMVNLLDNAFKFTPFGQISVRVRLVPARHGENTWTVLVTDTGEGVPVDRLDKIFEPFVQANSPTSRKHAGTGLGLSICKKLLTLMKGEIMVKSQLGKGTSFCLTLPQLNIPESNIMNKRSTPSPFFPQNVRERGPAGQGRILLAEDDEMNCFLIRELLEKSSYQVLVKGDGVGVLEAVATTKIDLILMDINMPVMDGFKAMTTIRKNEKKSGRHLPIIALTAMAFSEDKDKCLAAGADDFVTKPISAHRLFSAIQRLIGNNPVSLPGIGTQDFNGFRMDEVLKRAGGNRNVADHMVSLFFKNISAVRNRIEQTAVVEDVTGLCLALHKLKGMVSFFSDKGIFLRIGELEQAAGFKRISEVKAQLPVLGEELDNFICLLEKEFNLKKRDAE